MVSSPPASSVFALVRSDARRWVLLGAVVVCGAAFAQSPADQLPDWARQQWIALSKARSLEIATRMNPFVWRGDFDGDGRQDVALFVRATATKKEGIAFVLRGATQPVVVGAGAELGNGGDDFAWLDLWSVVEPPERAGADALLVEKESSASGIIRLHGGTARWEQRGD